jgi:hypothetical protein
MTTLGTMTLSVGEVAFFVRPPRPPRRGWRQRSEGIRRLIRFVRRELADAAGRPPMDVPRLRNFPY